MGCRNGNRGAVMVEFLLVFLLVATLFFCMVDFGFLLNAKMVITASAREGARKAAVDGGASPEALERIRHHLSLGRIDPDEVEIEIKPRSATYGTVIRVSLRYHYPVITPVVRSLLGEKVLLEAKVISRSEKVR